MFKNGPMNPLFSAAVTALLVLLATVALATAPVRVDLEHLGSGELLFATQQSGVYVPATKVSTTVDADIAGVVARVRVRQSFRNDGDDWVEAVYVFPLPENAAVDSLKLIVGERVIVGEVQPREQARQTYETAKSEGHRAGLVEQERPNMFTTSIANIAPGQTITVDIGYSQVLRYDGGRFSWRFPLAITPRYIPGEPLPRQSGGRGFAPDTDQVPDASRITPRYDADAKNPVTLRVRLNAGFPLQEVVSRYHPARVSHEGNEYRLEVRTTTAHDFELDWQPQVSRVPAAAAFSEDVAGDHYALILLMPPTRGATKEPPPRELIFVIDTSGSMNGTSIEQAKQALTLALERLRPHDRFNVIEFNDEAHALFSQPAPADRATVLMAERFVQRLHANGGTEMAKALRLALAGRAPEGYLRQVVFITDGSVGNEAALFRIIKERLHGANLFTVGIGSAPNSYFMRKAAEFGHGTYTYIGDVGEVGEKMQALFVKLEGPVLTDVRLVLPAGSEAYPATVPNLYRGEPVVVSAKVPTLNSVVAIRGRSGGHEWVRSLDLAKAAHGEIAIVWARAKVEELEDEMIRGGDAAKLEEEITRLALAHHLITDYTSLVAVDKTPARPAGSELHQDRVPLQVPAGQSVDPAMLKRQPKALVGTLAFDYDAYGYPTTATAAPLKLLLGAAAMLLAALLLLSGRRREAA